MFFRAPTVMSDPNVVPLRRARMAMGTIVEIDALDVAPDAIDGAFAVIAAYEAAFSFFRPESLLARINRASIGDEFALAPWQGEVLRDAMRFERAADLAFNANLGADLIRRGMRPALYDLAGVGAGAACECLRWLAPDRVRVDQRVCLDLGGFAKGAAVDAALERLADAGAASACVNAGGDLRVIGRREVGLRAVADWNRPARVTVLHDQAIASSVRYALDGPFHGERGLAILRRDRTTLDERAHGVAVVASTCAAADALTKIALVDGRIGDELLARHAGQLIELE